MKKLALLTLAGLLAFAAPATAEMMPTIKAGSATTISTSAPQQLLSLKKTAVNGLVNVIVGYKVTIAETDNRSKVINEAFTTLTTRIPTLVAGSNRIYRRYASLPYFAASLTTDTIDRLAKDSAITSLTPERAFDRLTVSNLPGINETKLSDLYNAPADSRKGEGMTVAIIDDGVDKTATPLANKIVGEFCFTGSGCTNDPSQPSDSSDDAQPCAGCNHGTHMAALIAGKSDTFSGIASEAGIVAIRVFGWSKGKARESDVLAALDTVYGIRNSENVTVVSLNLKSTDLFQDKCDDTDQPLYDAVDLLKSVKVAVVAGSGDNASKTSLAFPACLSNVVSVGATLSSNTGTCGTEPSVKEKVACFSNTSPNLTLLAPGAGIRSIISGGQTALGTGTAVAAAYAAGGYVLVGQALYFLHGQTVPSTDDITKRLVDTGTLKPDYRITTIKKPVIQLAKATDVSSEFVRLTYTKAGAGLGTVYVTEGQNKVAKTKCRTSCSVTVKYNTLLTLTPSVPVANGKFAGWSGDCAVKGVCRLIMKGDKAVTATFAPPTKR